MNVKWNDITKLKPLISDYEETHWYLVFDKYGTMLIAQYFLDIIEEEDKLETPEWIELGRDGYINMDILYWTELPEPPAIISN